MPSERTEVAGAALGGRIYVIGGLVPGGVTGAVEEYDPAANTWRARVSLPIAVHHAAAAAVGGRLYVIGGFDARWTPLAAVFEYDPAQDRWRPRAPLPTPRGALVAAVVDGRIIAVGGVGPGGDVTAVELYDPGQDRRRALPPMARYNLSGALRSPGGGLPWWFASTCCGR
jgi:N-acetylneuraminic acid mutarotase